MPKIVDIFVPFKKIAVFELCVDIQKTAQNFPKMHLDSNVYIFYSILYMPEGLVCFLFAGIEKPLVLKAL